MRCIECGHAAVALCPTCFVGQCEAHLVRSQRSRAGTGALAACTHPDRPTGERADTAASASRRS